MTPILPLKPPLWKASTALAWASIMAVLALEGLGQMRLDATGEGALDEVLEASAQISLKVNQ